jgi:protein TonB
MDRAQFGHNARSGKLRLALAALALTLVTGGSVTAAEPAPGTNGLLQHPDWLRPADSGQLRFYPPKALEAGIQGRAVIECVVTGDGGLAQCVVIEETPAGYGFGEATIRVAAQFRMKPVSYDGEQTAGRRVRVPLRWALNR